MSDGGPAFRVTFHTWCQDLFIDHKVTAAFQPRTNGRAERQIGLMKDLLKKNGSVIGGGLESLVAALNNRVSSVPQAASASTRFFGRELRLGLPGLSPPISVEKREKMMDAMRLHRKKYGKSLASHGTIQFKLNQPVLVFSPKIKQFSEKGHIHSWTPADDLLGPRSYTVRMDSGALRRVNASWMSPLPPTEEQ